MSDASNVQITPGSGIGIAADTDPSGNYVQITADAAMRGDILKAILAELRRQNLILCTMANLDFSQFERTDV